MYRHVIEYFICFRWWAVTEQADGINSWRTSPFCPVSATHDHISLASQLRKLLCNNTQYSHTHGIHSSLEQSLTAHTPLLMASSAFGLGKRCWVLSDVTETKKLHCKKTQQNYNCSIHSNMSKLKCCSTTKEVLKEKFIINVHYLLKSGATVDTQIRRI